ncbi:MAG: ABC transporter permease subunit [Myxococcales bacterium]|nr:ABC transporter permease subunit [Myxococcales bacterium]
MTVLHIAFDVVREAVARRHLAVVFALIAVAQITLAMALDLDIVGGAIVASRLFGSIAEQPSATGGVSVGAEEQLRPVFRVLVGAVYHLGVLFGIVATADIAVKSLSPGRVELLLSLPVRRAELLLGTYLGVALIALAGSIFAVGGFSAVLFWKAGFATTAPFFGALMAVLGFAIVYSAMLLATTVARSAALASGVGLAVYLLSVIADDREEVRSWFTAGWGREVAAWVIAPLPQLRTLGRIGRDIAGGQAFDGAQLAAAAAAAAAFAGACLIAALWQVERRDW